MPFVSFLCNDTRSLQPLGSLVGLGGGFVISGSTLSSFIKPFNKVFENRYNGFKKQVEPWRPIRENNQNTRGASYESLL